MKKSIIIALDVDSIDNAKEIINQTKDLVWGYKIGYQLFFRHMFSDELPKLFKEAGNVFLDLKLHDIPNTVSNALSSLSSLDPKMISIHSSGSRTMIKEAVDGRRKAWPKPGTGPILLAVTVLTSISKDNWKYMYPGTSMEAGFSSLLSESITAGANGIVCSGWEVGYVKKTYPRFLTVVPGIRQVKTNDDQARAISAKQAIDRGADYIVIGRPIIGTNNYRKATQNILDTL